MVDLQNNNSPFNVYVSKICPSGLIFGGGAYIWGREAYIWDFFFLFFNWASLHARLNSYYEAWSYKKRSTKKITGYRKFV